METVDSLLTELLDRFQKHRVPATWAVCDPAKHPLAEQLGHTEINHEVALLSDVTSDGRNLTRGQVSRTIVGRLVECQQAGIPVSTLAVNAVWQPQHLDLLTKHGVTMIRGAVREAAAPRGAARQGHYSVPTICYGLWYAPVSAALCGGGWMNCLSQLRQLRRTMDRTATSGGICHVQIDAISLARGDVAIGLRTVDRLLGHANHLRHAAGVSLETLKDTAARLRPKRNAPAARSILRAA